MSTALRLQVTNVMVAGADSTDDLEVLRHEVLSELVCRLLAYHQRPSAAPMIRAGSLTRSR